MSSVEKRAHNFRSLNEMTGRHISSKKIAGGAFKLSWLMAAMLVAGCGSYNKDHITVGTIPTDYRTKHPIIVSDNEIYEDLAISASTRVLSLRDRNVVRSIGQRFKRSGARSIQIVLPVGSRNERAARRIVGQISNELLEVGVVSSQISKIGRAHV